MVLVHLLSIFQGLEAKHDFVFVKFACVLASLLDGVGVLSILVRSDVNIETLLVAAGDGIRNVTVVGFHLGFEWCAVLALADTCAPFWPLDDHGDTTKFGGVHIWQLVGGDGFHGFIGKVVRASKNPLYIDTHSFTTFSILFKW